MTDFYSPTTTDQVCELVREHIVIEQSLDIRTGGSLISLGHKMDTAATLSLKELDKIKLYEPEELVITLEPGVNLAELQNILKEKNQQLRFEPPDYGPLLGSEPGCGTIGGIIGTNLSGPKRLVAGGARDYVLGIEGVSGFGKIFKAGGRVVKNVSGYDVSKLLTGSYGTLGAITEMTLKLSPLAETEATISLADLSDQEAVTLMSEIANSPYEVSGLAHLPGSGTHIRVEGTVASLAERTDAIVKIIGNRAASMLGKDESEGLWQQIRDVEPLAPPREIPLWKISVAASEVADIIKSHDPEFYFLDWAGGLLWMSCKVAPNIKSGAYWLIRNSAKPADLPFSNAPDRLTAMLSGRIKKAFDPRHILNPGRLGF